MSKSSNDKIKRIIKPLYTALILVIFTFIASSRESETASLSSLGLPDTSHSQNTFVDPSQQPQPEMPEIVLLQKNTLQSTHPPSIITPKVLGALVGGFYSEDVRGEIIEYTVEPGDNSWSIAAKFDISLNTLLWANNISSTTLIQSGQKLIISPVSGVIHYVKAGDVVSTIAEKYKAESEEIIAFNELSGDADLYVGDILVVPNGIVSTPTSIAANWAPIGDSYFICPISPPCRITQGLHYYNAIDFSHGKCGDPIYAAAGGTVQKVKLTNSTSRSAFGGGGNHITIMHPNGVVTWYGHISKSFVNPGQQVSQGQMIAFMGGYPGTPGAGNSTGCHVHFGVIGARNPFDK